jgi:hypothetical protein
MMRKILAVFGLRRSVSSVLRGFTDVIDELDLITETNRVKVADNHKRIDEIRQRNAKLEVEATNAKVVAGRLSSLIENV